jgi:two-component system chemotaxis sensor kinase CheA
MGEEKYKQVFISEARDHLDALNAALVQLEKDPHDKDVINQAFRAFHTLKGNSSALGYTHIAELAHGLEDMLSHIRDGDLSADRETMGILLPGLDLLEQGISSLETSEEEGIDPEAVLQDVRRILGAGKKAQVTNVPERCAIDDAMRARIAQVRNSGILPVRLIILLDVKAQLKGAKFQILLRRLREFGEILSTTPSMEEIRAERIGIDIETLILTSKPREELIQAARSVTGIVDAMALSIDEVYRKPEVLANQEREHHKNEITKAHHAAAVRQVQSVKVDMSRLDALMNLMGEMLINNLRLQDIVKRQDHASLQGMVAGLDRNIMDLQDKVHDIRMVPISSILARFPRMVRDLADHERKKIELTMDGTEVEFDRTVLDQIGEPLVHILRNSVDHGIETPDVRMSKGKPEMGEVKILVRREKSNAVIEITDDGQGIDPGLVKATCLRKGLATPEEVAKMSDAELQMLIFRAGASTNQVVTEVSGRGVGMDVVMSKTRELGGTVQLRSTVGTGTSITLRLPLTVAIATMLLVRAEDGVYCMQLSSVEQIMDIDARQVSTMQGHEVLLFRDKVIPLFSLRDVVGAPPERRERSTVVVVWRGESMVGIIVDEVVGEQPVLIKGLQELVKGTRGCAGATILGDGGIALILDIDTMF